MPPDSISGLLFAVFAIHLNFITRDQLAAATAEWIRQPTRPIAEILLEQEAIDRRTRGIVEDVVARHLDQHGGDTAQSIADLGAKGLIPPEITLMLHDSMTSDAMTEVSPGGDLSHASDSAALHGYAAVGARYLLVRPHDHGGMGEVFVGRDLELGRDVLLKQLPDKRADDPRHRAAFLKEVRAGAALEHPNIAPVYDVGEHEGGRLFQVMRLIPGGTFNEAILSHHASRGTVPEAQRLLRFRELLGHFVDVCQAIEYAHSRGVLHRDIKPKNIMLGSFGETQLIDWGLARIAGHDLSASSGSGVEPVSPDVVGDGSEATRHGQFKGTPAYASPEQAAGEVDRIDVRSDVYGLGATLYCLLTGESPYHAHSPSLMDDIRQGRFPRPRQVQGDVPPALESICLKAMAHKPFQRYASARDLATDVERWLADEPVLAHPDPIIVRLRRWARRHRTAVAAAAALLLTSLIGLAIGYVAVKEQRDVAQKSTELTLDAIEKIVINIGDEAWAQDPESETRRIEAMDVAITMFEDVLTTDPGNVRAKDGLAEANRRKGYLISLAGNSAESINHFQRSLEVAERDLKTDPTDPEKLRPIIDTRSDMARALLYMEGPASVEEFQRETCRRAAEAGSRFPGSKLIRELNARAEYALADILAAKGSFDEALVLTERAAREYSALADSDDGTEGQCMWAFAGWADVSQLCRRLGQVEKARDAARELELRNATLEAAGLQRMELRIAGAQTLRERVLTRSLDEHSDAISEMLLGDVVRTFTELYEDKPDVWRLNRERIHAYIDRGRLRLANDNLDGAERDADTAVEESTRMNAPPGAQAQARARACTLRGLVADRRGDQEMADSMFKRAGEQCTEARTLGFGAIADIEAEVWRRLEHPGRPRDASPRP